ncbi:two-component system sensor histidine kinase QseC [Desulfovibrio sp. OttesenSCG-928-O18]|nr:two-component system sensor histidine kinase QseC [Desulfovibrio sp. OttesenSCG-928-O18]
MFPQNRTRIGLPPLRLWSLRLRFSLFFSILLVLAWLLAALMAWKECRDYADEFFDTQQILFAKRLATADFGSLTDRLPSTRSALRENKDAQRGKFEDDALCFAVFTAAGDRLLTDGENGDDIIFAKNTHGFVNTTIYGSNDPWRIVWLTSPDGRYVVAVGQEVDYRDDLALDMLMEQIFPWAMLMPVLLLGMFWMLSRELAPLRGVAQNLETRAPEDTGTLETAGVPSEVRPLVTALNSLFARIGDMLARERAFISDAAHELRTPLTALRIQAEVARMATDDTEARQHALGNLLQGIDRSTQLVEQLLTLSRLESLRDLRLESTELVAGPLDWASLLAEAVLEHAPKAERKNITLECAVADELRPVQGYSPLATLLLRNLLDNAVKYTPEGGHIAVALETDSVTIENSGPGVPDSFIPKLGERFARPPGQKEPGSGLGLSIAKRAAALGGMRLTLRNRIGDEGGFMARIDFS